MHQQGGVPLLRRGFSFGRIFGIDIRVDVSVGLMVMLITWNLTVVLSRWHPDWGLPESFAVGLAGAIAYLASILLHELAHAIVARAHGIRVPSITLWLFGGVSSFEREPPHASAEFLSAVVGPLTSALLGAIFALLGGSALWPALQATNDPAEALATLGPVSSLLLWLGPVNIVLAVFNLLPAFPLDGGRVLRSILWALTRDLAKATRAATRASRAIAWSMMALGVLMALGVRVPVLGAGVAPGLWLALLGWFIAGAATQSWQRVIANELLKRVRVARLMRPQTLAVPAEASVQALVDTRVLRTDESAFPVADDERFVGLVSLEDVRKVPPSGWRFTRVAEVMTAREAVAVARPDDEASRAFEEMLNRELEQMPVVEDDDRLVGVLHLRDVMRWLELHEEGERTVRTSSPRISRT
jgi:Zn-dependent protease/CBS domain-containing protein